MKASTIRGERREAQRRPLVFEVESAGQTRLQCLGDVSVTGACFAADAPFSSEVLRLRFQLPPQSDYYEAQAYVVGRREAKVVVSFTHMDEDARLALAQWVHDP